MGALPTSGVIKGRKLTGKVYLVGAGPGDPGLITVKGMKVLQEAQVVVYDRLVDPAQLKFASKDAEMIYVGKGPPATDPTRDQPTPSGQSRPGIERGSA